MISLNLVAALGLLAVVAATPSYMDETPKPCCGPELFEGNIQITSSEQKPDSFEGTLSLGTIHFDAKNKRMANVVTVYSSVTGINKVNIVEGADATYLWVPKTEQCSKMPAVVISSCMSPKMKFQSTVRLGLPPSTIDVSVFGETTGNQYSGITVTKDTCIPTQQVSQNSEARSFWNFNYSNLVMGVKDMKVFDVPSYCKPENLVEMSPEVKDVFEVLRLQRFSDM